MTMRGLLFGLPVVAMVVAGCGDDDDDAATPTTASAGSDEAATTASADFDVVFDGEECTVTGPESVPAGEYTFVLTDTSGLSPVELYVRRYVDGHTHQELIDQQNEAGGPGVLIPKPDWVWPVVVDIDTSELDLAENQFQLDHVAEPGPHGMNVWSPERPDEQWFCTPPFEVT
jgi:hypothetical protein